MQRRVAQHSIDLGGEVIVGLLGNQAALAICQNVAGAHHRGGDHGLAQCQGLQQY